MRVAVRKLPGVQSVEVSLERALTQIRLNPGNSITLAQLRKILKDGGFNSGAADVEVVGTLEQRDGTPTFVVTGTTESYRLVSDPKHPEVMPSVIEAAKKSSAPVLLSGRVEADGRFLPDKVIRIE